MRKKIIGTLLLVFLPAVIFLIPEAICSEQSAEQFSQELKKLEGEILEVEELKEPQGAAIYTVRDFASGTTRRFFAHPYRTAVQMGVETQQVTDVIGGSKATIIYRDSADRETPEIVFAKVASTYYS